MDHETAYDEEGHHQLTVPFDLEEVERRLGEEQINLNDEQVKILGEALQRILAWIWQSGMSDHRGTLIRTTIACWVLHPEVAAMSLTELAQGMGLHKQSLGRWSDKWKEQFPDLKNSHMKMNTSKP